jgi:hypothetical protein
MTFPGSIVESFSAVEEGIRKLPWFDGSWSCCSGLWSTEQYGDTVVLRITKKNWCSVFPASVEEGGEIQYAAWVDEKLHRRSTVRFEMHVFSLLTGKKVRKRDFTDHFRQRNQSAINGFGFHDTNRGPGIPYAGTYRYKDLEDLASFLTKDFSNFASLSESIDEYLAMLEHFN